MDFLTLEESSLFVGRSAFVGGQGQGSPSAFLLCLKQECFPFFSEVVGKLATFVILSIRKKERSHPDASLPLGPGTLD